MQKIFQKRWFRVVVILVILAGVVAYLHWPVSVKIIISHETTRIEGPVNPDGTINYVAALNAMISEGVTPDNNAAILLIQALGPDIFPNQIRDKTFEILNLPSLPVKGDYFIALGDYVKANAPEAKTRPVSVPVEIENLEDKLPLRISGIPSSRPIKAEDQAYENLDQALERPWSAKEYPIIVGWLKANEKPLTMIATATKRPRYYVPLISQSQPPLVADVLLPTLGQYRAVARALSARAMLKVEAGDIEAAWADIMAAHRLARLISQDSTLIGWLVGMAAEDLACGAAKATATSGKLTVKQARAFLADLESLPPLPEVVEVIDRGERFMMLDCVMMMWRGRESELDEAFGVEVPKVSGTRGWTDWNEVLRAFNYWFDRQVVEVSHKCAFAERKEATIAFRDDLCRLSVQMRGASAQAKIVLKRLAGRPMRKSLSRDVANRLISTMMPALGRACEVHDEAVMRSRLTRLAMALAAHRAEKGQYPDKLDALVPAYLKAIPEDLFTDKPLKYSREGDGYFLYSVGPNMKDDGGSDDRDAEQDDISVRTGGGTE